MDGPSESSDSLAPTVDATCTEDRSLLSRAVLMIPSIGAPGDADLHVLSIANRPVLLRMLDSLAQAGIREVCVAVEPPLAPQVRRVVDAGRPLPLELSYLDCSPGEGLLGALTCAGELALGGPLLLHWACGLFRSSLRFLLGGARVGPLDTVVLVDPPHTDTPVVELASERLSALMDRPRGESRGSLAGVAVLGAAAPEVARALAPGGGTEPDLVALVGRMARLGGRVRMLPAGACWHYTGATDSALELNRFLLSDLVVDPPELEMREAIVQGGVEVDGSATIERSTIRGPVVIGPRARLYDAYVGPYTSIGADVCVEGAEIENSIVLDGTRISHLDRRLEASVVGPAAKICRDFRLPRALRMHVGEGARVSLT